MGDREVQPLEVAVGENIGKILSRVEDALLMHEVYRPDVPIEYSNDCLRSAIKVMFSVFMSKMWDLQERENIPMDIRADMAWQAGTQFRQLVKTYTGIDTHDI